MAREMKDSGIEWIGSVPAEWEVLRTKNAYSHHKNVVGNKSDNYERLALTLNGVVKRSKDDSTGLQPEAFNSYQILRENELVFKLIDLENISTSRVGLSPFEGLVSPAYIVLEPKENAFSKFGFYYFLSMWHRYIFNHLGDDGVRSSLNASDLLNIPYVAPPIFEQHRIADFLDRKCAEIDRVLEKTRASIEEYKKLKQSVITQAVTKGVRGEREMKDSGIEWIGEIPAEWKISRIKYVSSFEPPCDTSRLSPDSVITYTPMEYIKNGYYVPNTATLSSLSTSLTSYQSGDIVMAKVTPCFENGNISIMNNLSSAFGLGSSELFVFRAKSIHTQFLFYWLRNNRFVQTACSTMTGTGGLKRVSSLFVKDSSLAVPPESEQIEIANYLDKKCSEIDTLISKKEQFINELESYKKSLIYEYVTGKKEVQ